jgi:hypothetical protein
VEHGWSQGVGPADRPWWRCCGLDRALVVGVLIIIKRQDDYLVICSNCFSSINEMRVREN